jgi:SSS family solute:Na+ symporter
LVSLVRLAPLDAAIVIAFVVAILALGFSARLRANTTLQFIAAGRALTLPLFVATLVATWYGGILGIGESVKAFGVGTWLLLGVPYYVFAVFYAVVLAKRIRAADQISIPERIGSIWGKGPALVSAGLVFFLGVPAAHVLMLGILTEALTGWSLPVSIVVATVVSSLFLYKGGLLADARVSLLAFAMMYIGFAAMVAYCLVNHPLGATLASIEPASLKTADGGIGALGVLSFFILGAWTLIDPGFHQRVASAQDPATGRRGVLIAVVCWVVFDALSVTTGLYAIALLEPLPENGLLVFPLFAERVLPSGLKAVFLCGMLGTVLTAMVGYALVSGATLGRDVLGRALGVEDEAKAALLSRLGIAASCAAAIGLSLAFQSVVLLWYLWAGLVVGALLFPTLLSYLAKEPRRVSPAVVTVSLVLGFIISLAWLLYGSLSRKGLAVEVAQGVTYDVGTLLPGALVGGVVLALGTMAVGRSRR